MFLINNILFLILNSKADIASVTRHKVNKSVILRSDSTCDSPEPTPNVIVTLGPSGPERALFFN